MWKAQISANSTSISFGNPSWIWMSARHPVQAQPATFHFHLL